MEDALNKLVSIVIPVYNREKVLKRCVSSILSQTYKKLEVILVDDGSTDGTLAECQRLQQSDTRVKVISQKNAGVSAARNTGIRESSGMYVMFVDSDDYIDANTVEALYMGMENGHADIAICGICTHLPQNGIGVNIQLEDHIYEKDDFAAMFNTFLDYMRGFTFIAANKMFVWGKIKVLFQENRNSYEDYVFFVDYMKDCEKLVTVAGGCYHYDQSTSDSLAKAYHENDTEIVKYAHRRLIELWHKELGLSQLPEQLLLIYYIEIMRTCDKIIYNDKLKKSEKYKKIYEILSDKELEILWIKYRGLPIGLKIRDILLRGKHIRGYMLYIGMKRILSAAGRERE